MAKDKKQKQEKTSVFGQLLTNLFVGANLMTLVLLWVCVASIWLDASLHPRLAIVGLAFPILLVLNLLFVPFWLLFKPRMLVVPLLGMGVVGGYILDYHPLNLFGKDKEADLTLVSWNVNYMTYAGKDSAYIGWDYIKQSTADIICLQESPRGKATEEKFDSLTAEGWYLDSRGGLRVLSRFPILSGKSVTIPDAKRDHIEEVELLIGEDTVTLFNLHLECNSLSIDERDEYGEVLKSRDRDAMKSEAHFLAGKLAVSARSRGVQTNRLMERLDSLPQGRRVLLCGDFNDTPISNAYHKVDRRLKSAFRQGGAGLGISYLDWRFPVRIDHVFYSDNWQCKDAHFDDEQPCSDHLPLIVKLGKVEK